MSYVTQSRIESAIPAPHLRDALDDDRDGMPDAGVLTEIIASADQAVDALLAGLFAVPFSAPAPAAAAEASFVFACERIYERRQIAEKNPWTAKADAWRERLDKIGKGELLLDAATAGATTPGVFISDSVAINSSMR